MATLQDIPQLVARAIRTGTNLHMVGEPGIGKTEVIEQTVDQIQEQDKDFWFGSMYTPALSPVDFTVAMPDTKSGELKTYHSDRLPNGFDTPDLRGILFLGERDNADPATNKALQKYINNEDMGGLRKPKGVIVISDSNDVGHRSGAVQQSLALLSRSRLLSIVVDPDVTLKYFGEIGINPYVQAYLSLRKEHVSTFDSVLKSREYRVWANPRAWERVSKGLNDADEHQQTLSNEEIIGDLGEAVGREFVGFMHAATKLVSYDEIIADPKKAPKPDSMSDTYAIIAMLATTVKASDLVKVRTYVERFGLEVQVLFLRLLTSSQSGNAKACASTSAYIEWFSIPDIRSAILGT